MSVALTLAGAPPDVHPAGPAVVDVPPAAATLPAAHDVDDPALWVNRADPSKSTIVVTVKAAAPDGALNVYDLQGRLVQVVPNLDRPNNVDVEYGFRFGGREVDLVVATERYARQLRVFRVGADRGRLIEVGRVPVLQGQRGERGAPMGIGLYKRPHDGAVFAIVAPKSGGARDYLWQYRLEDDGAGAVRAVLVRRFGRFSGKDDIEAVAVDDALGYVYYADDQHGIFKWHADPDHPDAGRELALFGRDDFRGDREGIAVYGFPDGTGYLICVDQLPQNSEYRVYRREGAPGRPHDHSRAVKVVRGGAHATDGIEVSSSALGPRFPAGVLIAMKSDTRNFLLFRWEDIALAGRPRLELTTGAVRAPSSRGSNAHPLE